MRFPTSRSRLLVGALAAGLLLTACGSGGDSSGGDGGGSTSTPKDTAPSKADFTEAKTALSDLKADYQTVYASGAAVQKTSVAYFKSHPKGTADDEALASVTTAFDEAVQKRDDAAEEVAQLDALKDADVAKAYETFTTKAEKGDQFHDSLFAAFPLLQQTFAACGDVFTSTKVPGTPSSATEYGRLALAKYRPAIADCLPVLKELSGSDNASLAAFGSGFTKIVDKRRTLLTQLSTGDLGMDAFTVKYKAVAAQVSKVGKSLEFQPQLNALSPVPEFLALEKVVAGKVA